MLLQPVSAEKGINARPGGIPFGSATAGPVEVLEAASVALGPAAGVVTYTADGDLEGFCGLLLVEFFQVGLAHAYAQASYFPGEHADGFVLGLDDPHQPF